MSSDADQGNEDSVVHGNRPQQAGATGRSQVKEADEGFHDERGRKQEHD